MRKIFINLWLFIVLCLTSSFVEQQPTVTTHQTQVVKQAEPHIMVVMGLTGDLGQRKIIPALYNLFIYGYLPENFAIVGVARSRLTQTEFENLIKQSIKTYVSNAIGDSIYMQQFLAKLSYTQLNSVNPEDYDSLNNVLKDLDLQHNTQGNRLFFLAVAPSLFPNIISNLHDRHLITKANASGQPWSRVIIEKPFGSDWQSAQHLKQHISKYLDDSQIYLIDHFLGKAVAQNLLPLRFSNPLFTTIWSRDFIENVQITFSEDIGIGDRGNFWEETGLLRDIIQNHMMQLLSLIAMEPPENFESESIRKEKVKVVQAIRPFAIDNLDRQIVRSQYAAGLVQNKEVIGYLDEPNVNPKSTVETFVAAKLYIDNERWEGVPFYIRGGKRLADRRTEIVVTFKDPNPTELISPNKLVIRVQPNEEIYLEFNTKLPGIHGNIQTHRMRFDYSQALYTRIPDAYETLIFEGMIGNSNQFVSLDEIMASWKLYTPVLETWKILNDLSTYPAGVISPEAAKDLVEAGHQWFDPVISL